MTIYAWIRFVGALTSIALILVLSARIKAWARRGGGSCHV